MMDRRSFIGLMSGFAAALTVDPRSILQHVEQAVPEPVRQPHTSSPYQLWVNDKPYDLLSGHVSTRQELEEIGSLNGYRRYAPGIASSELHVQLLLVEDDYAMQFFVGPDKLELVVPKLKLRAYGHLVKLNVSARHGSIEKEVVWRLTGPAKVI